MFDPHRKSISRSAQKLPPKKKRCGRRGQGRADGVWGKHVTVAGRDPNDLFTKVVINRQVDEGGESIGQQMEEKGRERVLYQIPC